MWVILGSAHIIISVYPFGDMLFSIIFIFLVLFINKILILLFGSFQLSIWSYIYTIEYLNDII